MFRQMIKACKSDLHYKYDEDTGLKSINDLPNSLNDARLTAQGSGNADYFLPQRLYNEGVRFFHSDIEQLDA